MCWDACPCLACEPTRVSARAWRARLAPASLGSRSAAVHRAGGADRPFPNLLQIPSFFEPCGLTQLIALRYGARRSAAARAAAVRLASSCRYMPCLAADRRQAAICEYKLHREPARPRLTTRPHSTLPPLGAPGTVPIVNHTGWRVGAGLGPGWDRGGGRSSDETGGAPRVDAEGSGRCPHPVHPPRPPMRPIGPPADPPDRRVVLDRAARDGAAQPIGMHRASHICVGHRGPGRHREGRGRQQRARVRQKRLCFFR